MLKKKTLEENISCDAVEDKSFQVAIKGLLTLAKGVTIKESSEEFVTGENGEMILKSKKVVTKKLAPDLSAIKFLLDKKGSDSLSLLTDDELKRETQRLLGLLKEEMF